MAQIPANTSMNSDPSSMAEIHRRIRKGTMIMFDIARAIDKLPPCDVKSELTVKAEDVAAKLNQLHNLITEVDSESCMYGYTAKCPGCMCELCQYALRVDELRMSSDSFHYADDAR